MDVLERDFYEERRRKWRRSAFWRGVIATVGALALLLGVGVWMAGDLPLGTHIARFEVNGVISDDPERDRLLDEIAEDTNAQALVVAINSPGGTTAGSEALFAALRAVAAQKPVVATMGEVAASGGYITAIAADHIIARGNSLTGSIGVIMEYPDLTEVMAKLGIGLETVRSSQLKAEPSPFRPTSPVARALDEALVAEGYGWFRGLVGERRGLQGPALDQVANGAVFSGRLALANGLVDEIGGEPQALAWLAAQDGDLDGLPVRTWELGKDKGLLEQVVAGAASGRGFLEALSFPGVQGLYSIAR